MWLIAVRDLQHRCRRFLAGVLGAALLLAVTLLLAGVTSALHGEADRNVQALGADAFVVRAGAGGPFSTLSALPDTVVEQVAKSPGVAQADPLVMAFATTGGAREVDVTVIGYRPGGLGPPVPVAGRQPSRPNEAMVDRSTGYRLGDSFTVNGLGFTVVGQVEHMTLRGGVGNVYLNIRDAQSALFKGNRVVTSIVTRGVPTNTAALGLEVVSPQDARDDLVHLLGKALDAVDLVNLLLWALAIAVVGATIQLSVPGRVEDFAVLRAIGVTARTLVASLAIQAMVVSLGAAVLAIVAGYALAPLFPLPVYFSPAHAAAVVGIAAGAGVLASLAVARRVAGVDPAKAFGV